MMSLIQISLDPLNADVQALLDGHRRWLKKYAEKGVFLLFGPYDNHKGGLIIAQTENNETLQSILAEDVYYPNQLATYQIQPFSVKFVANTLGEKNVEH